ncbi:MULTISPECIES: hypothetical protein [Streptomyces]
MITPRGEKVSCPPGGVVLDAERCPAAMCGGGGTAPLGSPQQR